MEVLDPVWGMPVDPATTPFTAERWGSTYYFVDTEQRRKFIEGSRVAYFSMEIGLRSDIPTYSGGLGVLAGDTIRSASDLHIPSVQDGWWVEDAAGWAIGPPPDAMVGDEERRAMEIDDLYSKLEYIIVPKFYNERDIWTGMMQTSIGKVAYNFNTHRMMRRYVSEAYL